MSLLFFDGFQGLNTSSNILAEDDLSLGRYDVGNTEYIRGETLNNTYNPPSPNLPFAILSSTSELVKIIPESNPVIVGMRILPGLQGTSPAQITLVRFLDSVGTIHGTLRVTVTGSLQILRGDSATLLSSSVPGVLSVGQWSYVECKYFVNDTTGGYEIRVNGNMVLTGSAADTRNAGNANVGRIRWGGSGQYGLDDIYIVNTGSLINNDFLGDVIVVEQLVTGNGSINNFGANTGSNFSAVRDAGGENGDVTFVSASQSGFIDLYTIETPTFTAQNVYGVSVGTFVRKTELGNQNLQLLVSGTTINSSSRTFPVESSYQEKIHIWEQNPETSANWTLNNLNNLQIGFKIP